jgi:CrcB protein
MVTLGIVFLGAGLGGVARYAVGGWVQELGGAAFPWGTLAVNISGALLIGLLFRFSEGTALRPEWRLFGAVGFCGGYTTFSTFSFEAVKLLQDGQWQRAFGYALASVIGSIIAVLVGFSLAEFMLRKG